MKAWTSKGTEKSLQPLTWKKVALLWSYCTELQVWVIELLPSNTVVQVMVVEWNGSSLNLESLLQLQPFANARRAGDGLRTRTLLLVCHWPTATSLSLRSRLGDWLSGLPVRERRWAPRLLDNVACFYALQVRTRTYKLFSTRKISFI